jgi:hypothetical protein
VRHFHRVLALGLSDNPIIRADFEDEMASRVPATQVGMIPGNTILLRPEGAELDLDYLKNTDSRTHDRCCRSFATREHKKHGNLHSGGSLYASVLEQLLRVLQRRISCGLQSWLFERKKESTNRNNFLFQLFYRRRTRQDVHH